MKKFLLIIGILVALIVLIVAGLLIYAKTALPNVGPPEELTIDITPERVERGEYLAKHVMLCLDCHAHRDFSLFAGPPIPGTMGGGGDIFDQSMGFPGRFISKNLTPFALSDWTDGEIFRAVTAGVNKDGKALFPVMPYLVYGKLDPEDIYSVIAYLRTLDPIKNELEESVPDFPMNFILNTIPTKPNFGKRPDPSNRLEYGKYVFTAAACGECHTNQVKGKIVGEPYAGGFEFKFPDGSILRSANITQHPTTGIGMWTKEMFVERFKMYADSSYTPHQVKPGDFQTVMPWIMYAGMETEDLEAMFDYMKTIPAVDNKVELYTPANPY